MSDPVARLNAALADGELKAQIPWLRVFVEGVVIVGSILMALGADAAWDYRDDRQQERAYLRALLLEARAAQTELDIDQGGRFSRMAALDSLQVRFGQGGTDSGLVAEWARRATGLQFFFPPTSVYDDLVSSGGLRLIRSRELRVALMTYAQESSRLRRMEERELDQIEFRFRPYLVESFAMDADVASEAMATQMLSDRRFHNLVFERRGRFETTLTYAARVEGALRDIVEILEGQVGVTQ